MNLSLPKPFGAVSARKQRARLTVRVSPEPAEFGPTSTPSPAASGSSNPAKERDSGHAASTSSPSTYNANAPYWRAGNSVQNPLNQRPAPASNPPTFNQLPLRWGSNPALTRIQQQQTAQQQERAQRGGFTAPQPPSRTATQPAPRNNNAANLTISSPGQPPTRPSPAPPSIQQAKPKPDSRSCLRFPFTLHQLKELYAVKLTGNTQRAGRLLSLEGKQSVYYTLRRLEQVLNGRLTVPVSHENLRLTDTGSLLATYAEKILGVAHDTVLVMRDFNRVKPGIIRVGGSQTTGVYILPDVIHKFHAEHPEIDFQLRVDSTRRICRALARGELDLALVGGEIPDDVKGTIQAFPYKTERMILVVGGESTQAREVRSSPEGIPLEKLYEWPLVSMNRNSSVTSSKNTILEEGGLDTSRFSLTLEVNSMEAMKRAIMLGTGAAFIAETAVQNELKSGRMVEVPLSGLVKLERSIRVLVNTSRYRPAAVREFVGACFAIETPDQSILMSPPEDSESDWLQQSLQSFTMNRKFLGDMDDLGALTEDLEDRPPRLTFDDRPSTPPRVKSAMILRSAAGSRPPDSDRDPGTPITIELPQIPFTLAQLTTFHTVIESGSLLAASENLYLSSAAVSKTISALEETLGAQLIIRSKNKNQPREQPKVYLTEAGLLFSRYSSAILGLAVDAMNACTDINSAALGSVKLGASQTTGTYLMPRLIGMFRERYPQIQLSLTVDTSRRVCRSVARGEIDVGIIGGEVPPDTFETLQVVTYAKDELVLIVPKNHPMAKRGVIDKADLLMLHFVSLNEGSSVQVAQESTLRRNGILWSELDVVMKFNSVEAIKSAVHFGLGAAFVSGSAIEKELDLGLLSKVQIQGVRLYRSLNLVTDRNRYYSVAARKFMQEVLNFVPQKHIGDTDPVVPEFGSLEKGAASGVDLGMQRAREASSVGQAVGQAAAHTLRNDGLDNSDAPLRHTRARPWEMPDNGQSGPTGSTKPPNS